LAKTYEVEEYHEEDKDEDEDKDEADGDDQAEDGEKDPSWDPEASSTAEGVAETEQDNPPTAAAGTSELQLHTHIEEHGFWDRLFPPVLVTSFASVHRSVSTSIQRSFSHNLTLSFCDVNNLEFSESEQPSFQNEDVKDSIVEDDEEVPRSRLATDFTADTSIASDTIGSSTGASKNSSRTRADSAMSVEFSECPVSLTTMPIPEVSESAWQDASSSQDEDDLPLPWK
jgi:hypothetical protein